MVDYRSPNGRFNYENEPPLVPVDGSGLTLVYGTPPTSVLRGIQLSSGITADRPASPLTGCMYFDETLGYPIWYNGTIWVDSTGAGV